VSLSSLKSSYLSLFFHSSLSLSPLSFPPPSPQYLCLSLSFHSLTRPFFFNPTISHIYGDASPLSLPVTLSDPIFLFLVVPLTNYVPRYQITPLLVVEWCTTFHFWGPYCPGLRPVAYKTPSLVPPPLYLACHRMCWVRYKKKLTRTMSFLRLPLDKNKRKGGEVGRTPPWTLLCPYSLTIKEPNWFSVCLFMLRFCSLVCLLSFVCYHPALVVYHQLLWSENGFVLVWIVCEISMLGCYVRMTCTVPGPLDLLSVYWCCLVLVLLISWVCLGTPVPRGTSKVRCPLCHVGWSCVDCYCYGCTLSWFDAWIYFSKLALGKLVPVVLVRWEPEGRVVPYCFGLVCFCTLVP
jgi:hypothetical protein